MAVQAYHCSNPEAEAGGPHIPDKPELPGETQETNRMTVSIFCVWVRVRAEVCTCVWWPEVDVGYLF